MPRAPFVDHFVVALFPGLRTRCSKVSELLSSYLILLCILYKKSPSYAKPIFACQLLIKHSHAEDTVFRVSSIVLGLRREGANEELDIVDRHIWPAQSLTCPMERTSRRKSIIPSILQPTKPHIPWHVRRSFFASIKAREVLAERTIKVVSLTLGTHPYLPRWVPSLLVQNAIFLGSPFTRLQLAETASMASMAFRTSISQAPGQVFPARKSPLAE